MSAARKLESLNENFLTCSICTEGYKDPCTLTCGHTFCKGCLGIFLKTRQDPIRAKSLSCPYCRQMTRVPRPDRPVEGWVKQIKMRSVLTHNKGLITHCFDDTGRSLLKHRSQIDAISHNKDKIKSQIRQASQKAMDVIKQKEKQLMEELNEMTEKQSGQLRGRIKSGEIDMQMYQQYIEYITQVLKSGSETDMFDIYQICQSGAITEATDRDVPFTDSVPDSKRIFVSEIDEGKLHKVVQLGRIQQNVCDVMDTRLGKTQSGKFDVMCRPVLHKTVGIKVNGDRSQPFPYDVTVLVVDDEETLVVTDYSNTCLKSFYTKNNISRHSKLDLASNPYTVTRLSDNQVAVSFWSHNVIVIVRVTPDLVLESRVTTKKKYRCLTAMSPSTLAAGCWHPPCVDILDVSGRVMRSVSTPDTGQKFICNPEFLCPSDMGNILVSDAGSHSVYCITPEGDVVFTYTPKGEKRLSLPQGITTTSTGHILVADYPAHRVILLTAAGEFVRDLLTSQDGLQYPHGLMFCDCKLYVGEYSGDAVKVFTCSTPP
ncbi:uncharacterized protein [Haliotis cracherodii]|uniref:uncharacterized protein n=1 Tax=Haliotis cracherodii TaxID=6455 RepID=UPI0039E8D5CE